MGNIIGSDGSHARVDEETALVCDQRRRTGGATAVRGWMMMGGVVRNVWY